MSQLWAFVGKSGRFTLHYTGSLDDRPEDHGHRADCRRKNVWPLDRDPDAANGEGVDFETGAFDFEIARVRASLVAEIRAAAATAIEAISPLWRQQNDTRAPSPEGEARFARIDAVRAASNDLEAKIDKSRNAAAIRAIRADIARLGKGELA